MAVEDSELQEEFENLGISLTDEDVIDKLKEICMIRRLTAERILEEWVAFRLSNGHPDLTLDALEQFDRESLNRPVNKTPKLAKTKNTNHAIYDITTIHQSPMDYEEEDNDDVLLNSYSTPAAKKKNKRLCSPDVNLNSSKRLTSLGRSPVVPFSPSSFSPVSVAPSKKYSSRGNSGTTVCSLGSLDNVSWVQNNHITCSIKLLEESHSLTHRYKFMFEKIKNRANVLNSLIEDMSDLLQRHYNLDDISPLHIPSPDQVTVIGKIVSDSSNKLMPDTVLLEGPIDICGGRKVSLDLRHLEGCSLFSGQIVALEGLNNSGNKIIVKKLFASVMLPFPEPDLKELQGPLHVLVAAGPFTTLDSLSYEPLADLIQYIIKHQPDVCFLIGPFVDSKHEHIEKCTLNMTFDELFEKQMDMIIKATEHLPTQLIIVPSLRDVHHDYIYPVPPFYLKHIGVKNQYKNAHFVSDPSLVSIRGITFGVTSTDILFHLGKEETSLHIKTSDRLARLVQHILSQHSFYPLNPPSEDVNIDYEYFEQYAKFYVTPHVLILPSDLKCFIKDVNGCCCINPERLAKGMVGGTYARLIIDPSGKSILSSNSVIPLITAEVIRI